MFDKALANPNYIPVYMKIYYLFTLCLFKVDRLFSKLAIPKYMFVFVIKLSKERTDILCTGEHSSVSNVNCVLWRGGPEIFPVCPDVDSMC